MEYCWKRSDESGMAPIYITSSVIFILISMMGDFHPAMRLLFVPVVLWNLHLATISARKYSVSPEGMTISRPFGRKRMIPWNEFSEVALCKIHYTNVGHVLAIRCVIGREADGPSQALWAKERWQTVGYEALHHKKVISIYFTQARYDAISNVCPLRIRDFRYLRDFLG